MRLTAANQAITPASMRSVFSSRPMPSAKRRTARGLSRATGKPCAHSKEKDCFSYPPVASMATSSTPCCRQKASNSALPSGVLGKERAGPWGPIQASREKEETSTPQNHLGHGNLPCTCDGSLATVRSCVTAAAVPKLPRGGCQRGYGRRPPREGFEISNPSQRHSHLNLSPLSRYKRTIVNQISDEESVLATAIQGRIDGRVRPCSLCTEKACRSTVKIFLMPSRSATRRSVASARSMGRLAYLRMSSRIRVTSPESSGRSCKAPRSSISQRAS